MKNCEMAEFQGMKFALSCFKKGSNKLIASRMGSFWMGFLKT